MNFKKSIILLMLFSIIISLSACNKSKKESEMDDIIIVHTEQSKLTLSDVTRSAELILRGTVTGIQKDYQTNPDGNKADKGIPLPNYPVRLYTIQIEELYHGEVEGETLTLKITGSSDQLTNAVYTDKNVEEERKTPFFINPGKEYVFYLRYQTQEDAARFGDDAGWRLVLGRVGAFEKQEDGTFANMKKGTNHLTLTTEQVQKEIAALKEKKTE